MKFFAIRKSNKSLYCFEWITSSRLVNVIVAYLKFRTYVFNYFLKIIFPLHIEYQAQIMAVIESTFMPKKKGILWICYSRSTNNKNSCSLSVLNLRW